MKALENRLEHLIQLGVEGISKASESKLTYSVSPEKWSKKEILGHLIDSGVNNLQRFTEIQFKTKPYTFDNYKQADLVKANDYQHAEINELLGLWKAINNRIRYLFSIQNETTLGYKVVLGSGEVSDLQFLMVDYVDHLEYHLKQILG
ncbi:DinB family protein [Flaviramulus aquimarinus]|uniref:DinB family protein n=1 Tax=Flaviramulus aquimarinus TaxID=1170456 RepID=A0ABP9FDX2_9FLAO